MNQITEIVAEILTAKFNVPPDVIREEASFEDLALDSLAQVELRELISERFGITFTDEEMLDLASLNDIVTLISERTKAVP